MQKQIERLCNGFARAKLCLCALCVLFYLAILAAGGAALWGLFVFVACGAVYLYLPGRFWVRATGMERLLPEYTAPLSILLGTGFLAVTYCFARRLDMLWLLRLLPPALGLVWLAVRCKAAADGAAGQKPGLSKNDLVSHFQMAGKRLCADGRRLSYAALWGVLLVLFACQISIKNAHPAAVGEIILTQDVLWNIGNANSFAIAFPPQDIRFSMVRLAYHYLTEMTLGVLSMVSGVSCYDIEVFYAAPLVLAAMLCCAHALGRCFYKGDAAKTFCFPFLLLCFNCASLWTALQNGRGVFGNTNLMHLTTNINGQATAVIFLSIFVILFAELTRRNFAVSWRFLAVFLCSFVLVCFSKGPAAAIAVCSFAITMLFVFFRRPRAVKAAAAFVGVIAIFLVVYFTIFSSGANTSVRFGFRSIEESIVGGWLGGLLGAGGGVRAAALAFGALLLVFCMQPLQTVLYAKVLWRDVRGLWRLPAERLFAHGMVAGGFLAYFLFWHPSYSQLYFALTAIFFYNLLAADALAAPVQRGARALRTACGAVGLATTMVLLVNFTGSGMRQLARNLDIIPKYPYVSTARAGDEAAMQWLRVHTPQSAQFATNRIHSMRNATDGISSLYTAMSGRQAYMEGYTYAVTNMGVSEPVVAEKRAVNAALFSAETPPEQVLQLCARENIQYLVFSKQYPGDTAQLSGCRVVYENDDVTIYAADAAD